MVSTPRVSVQDVLNCSFSNWYPIFEKHSLKSAILPLTDDVLEYLRSDEFYLPTSANKVMDEMRHEKNESSDDDDDDDDEDSVSDFSSSLLDEFDAVFPKLNWSSPKDARWVVVDNRLKCTNLAEIFLLLKSSDFITHDLSEPFKFCHDDRPDLLPTIPYVLVLRKWSALQPAKEFRCFVKNNRIIAISQRDCENFYSHIGSAAEEIRTNLCEFFTEKIQKKFFSSDFIVDIYRKDADRLYIIDFNPWGPMTDALLFGWAELMDLAAEVKWQREEKNVDFRYVRSQNGIKANSYSQYAIPKDIADITRDRDVNKLAEVFAVSQTKRKFENSTKIHVDF
uniref:Cell division cycle protein 123-like protein n=1 Tax=Philodina roseola TaxID=96448 RepID=B6S349_PHIRO|nr:cell division cycle protein 123-like protein [Philodina roseola]